MTDLTTYHSQRLTNWRQTPETKLPGVEEAPELIERLGIVTLYPVSPEVPNLFHAYMGDPNRKTDSKWDSPSGEVYTWRWGLGGKSAAFYTTLVKKRPTWISWALTPALLRLKAERRTADELYQAGELSEAARRVARALTESGGVLNTGDLRKKASFPTGKEYRAAYLKAVEELEGLGLLAKAFSESQQGDEMYHAYVPVRYAEQMDAAWEMTEEQAKRKILEAYLSQAVYALPQTLAKDLGLPKGSFTAELEQLCSEGRVEKFASSDLKETCYIAI
jgi:hypothetical protein